MSLTIQVPQNTLTSLCMILRYIHLPLFHQVADTNWPHPNLAGLFKREVSTIACWCRAKVSYQCALGRYETSKPRS